MTLGRAGAWRLPHLLHAEGEDLRIGRGDALPLAPRLAQRAPRPLGEHRDLRGEVGRLGVGAGAPARRRDRAPMASVRTPRTPSPSTSSASTGKPVNRLTPSSSAARAEPAHHFAERGGVVARVVHGGRRGDPLRAAPRSASTPLRPSPADGRGNRRAARSGKSSTKARGLTTAPERLCSPSAPAFSSTPMLRSDMPPPVSRSRFDQPRQLDGAGETGGARADDQHVHLDGFGIRDVVEDQAVEGEWRLMPGRHDGRHGRELLWAWDGEQRRQEYNRASLGRWTSARRCATPGCGVSYS